MKLDIDLFSCSGPKHSNEDSTCIASADNGTYIIAIADGVSGSNGGDIASNIVTTVIKNTFEENPRASISKFFEHAKDALDNKSKTDKRYPNLSTTLTVCKIEETKVQIGHVGDTRLYHLRGKGIVTRTEDQTEVQHLINEGVLTKARAKKYHRRNVLLSVLSPTIDYELYQEEFDINNNDRLLLVSDGLYSCITKHQIRDLSKGSKDIFDLCKILKVTAEESIPSDDYTAICIEYHSNKG